MRTKVIHIGNSLGIRIPKVFIEDCNIKDEVILEKSKDNLIVKPIKKNPRSGWDEAFKKMAENGDDKLIMDDLIPNQFDDEEWEW